jgi:hypothetical protein
LSQLKNHLPLGRWRKGPCRKLISFKHDLIINRLIDKSWISSCFNREILLLKRGRKKRYWQPISFQHDLISDHVSDKRELVFVSVEKTSSS